MLQIDEQLGTSFATFSLYMFVLISVHVESYEEKNGKRNYSKTAYCLFCHGKYTSKMSKHLFAVHSNEPKVQEIKKLEISSKRRKKELQRLLNEGNFAHNAKVINMIIQKLLLHSK